MGGDAFQARDCCRLGDRLQVVEQTPGRTARCLALNRVPLLLWGANVFGLALAVEVDVGFCPVVSSLFGVQGVVFDVNGALT